MCTGKKVFRFRDKDNTNPKLGNIPTFSIDRTRSCKGRSAVCQEVCYGACNRPTWKSSRVRLLTYYSLSLTATFANDMIASLAGVNPPGFRIHDLGDFYSCIYIRKWLKIVRARRDLKFFAYTRAWTLRPLVPDLARLAAEPNMTLFLSVDGSMLSHPLPHELSHLPRSWLAVDDDDIPPKDLRVDLVFRNLRKELTPLGDPNHFGAMVCLAETGRGKTTCDRCRFCVSRWKEERADVAPVRYAAPADREQVPSSKSHLLSAPCLQHVST